MVAYDSGPEPFHRRRPQHCQRADLVPSDQISISKAFEAPQMVRASDSISGRGLYDGISRGQVPDRSFLNWERYDNDLELVPPHWQMKIELSLNRMNQ